MVYDLPQIDGVDWEVAHRFLTNQDMLKNALCDFVRTAAKQTSELISYREQLEQDPTADNFATFRIRAHAMKSALRSIGSELYEEAFSLETAGRNENIDVISEYTDLFCKEYMSLAARLKVITGDVDSGIDFDHGLFLEKISEIKKSMESFDINALQEAYRVIQDMATPAEFEEEMNKLSVAVRDLESEQVIASCDVLEGMPI